jgi:tetratricopeptide (TPR) repeat protein
LIKTADGYHLWSETFDRELDDIFAIQAEIADRVTGALQVALLGPAGGNVDAERNAEAYEEYLRGMYIYQRNIDDRDGLTRARDHFGRALEIDTDYVDGHWGMFKVWDRWHRNGHGSYDESAEQIAYYGAKLKQLAPGSEQESSANARSALIHWDLLQANEILEDAVRRYPGSSRILSRYGAQTALLGNFDDGLAALQEAVRLDPLSLEYMSVMAFAQQRAGDCEGARQTMDRVLALDTGAGRVRYHLAMCIFETTGNADRALEIASNEPLGFMHNTALAILFHRLGNTESAQQRVDSMVAEYGDSAAYQYGQVYAQWGDTYTALEWLETAIAVRDPGLAQAGTDPLLESLSDEPRFVKVLESAGFR